MKQASVQQFMREYWPLVHHKSFPEDADYIKLIKQKYGNDAVNTLLSFKERYEKTSSEDILVERMNFLYSTGIWDDYCPTARTKCTLELILHRLSQEKQPVTIADLGSGDGRISIGIAAYLNKLKRVYAIEISNGGVEVLEKRMNNLPEKISRKAKRKIITVCGNYTTPEITNNIEEKEPEGIDTVIAAHPCACIHTLGSVYAKITHADGQILLCYPFGDRLSELQDEEIAEQFQWEQNESTVYTGVSYQVTDIKRYRKNKGIVLSVGRRIN